MKEKSVLSSEQAYDLIMGLSSLTGSRLTADIARVLGDLSPPDFSVSLNTKQLASKLWLRDAVFETYGATFGTIFIMGGWYGVLSALFFDDERFAIDLIASLDIDPDCEIVATLLNRRFVKEGRFKAVTGDMYGFDITGYQDRGPSLVINTSAEHIPDLRLWLSGLPKGQRVVIQSNDYRQITEHVSCVSSVEELVVSAALSKVDFQGTLPTRRYQRFMVMGST
ncbi:MAG: class I SAM-dependent methyltransferase [Beijerinckiaceae bacterium]